MTRRLDPSGTVRTRDFGGPSPYWTILDGNVLVAETFQEILREVPDEDIVLDPVAVLELLEFNHLLGTRTIVRGVHRMPWRAELSADGSLHRRAPIPHGWRRARPRHIAEGLIDRLEGELRGAAQEVDTVQVLLTGGYDSRIVAGTLKRVEAEIPADIEAVTWGLEGSRDVVYARRIANWFDWSFTRIPYDADLVRRNLHKSACWGGAEVSALHYHAVEWFEGAHEDTLVVAASFGDSVGRAEFSSQHITELRLEPIENTRGLLRPEFVPELRQSALEDRRSAWTVAESAPELVKAELHQQENYMRRMMQHPLDYIRQYCQLHQAYTSRDVVEFMWSFHPKDRVDEVYHHILRILDERLYSLPWARTGVAPDGTCEQDESLTQRYDRIGTWVREDLRSDVEPLFFSEELRELSFMHEDSLDRLWSTFLSEPRDGKRSAEDVYKLAGVALARKKFRLDSPPLQTSDSDLTEILRTHRERFRDRTRNVAMRLRRTLSA